MSDRAIPASPCPATLVRRVRVRVLDVSRAGCRLESDRRLEPGVAGQLVLTIEGRLRTQDIRVAHCQSREGAGALYHVGAELLRTRRLTDRSVRMAVRRFIGEAGASQGPGGVLLDSTALGDGGRRDERDKAVGRAPPSWVDPR